MGDERAHAGGQPRAGAARLQQRAQRGDRDPAEAVLTEVRQGARAGQHAGPVGQRRLDGDQRGVLTPRAALSRSAGERFAASSRTVSHFCLLDSTGSASR